MRTDRRELRLRLERMAFTQSGYFTAAQALDAGYSYQAQKYHVDAGNWLRVERGLFRLPHWPVEEHDHLVRLQLAVGPQAAFSHATALALHGLSDSNPRRLHMTASSGRALTDPSVIVHRGHLGDEDVETRSGWRVTTPVRTLIDAAGDAELSQEIVDDAVADAVERGLTTARRLRRASDEAPAASALRVERALGRLAERAAR
ncbi:type IV toxin-antitoxin system AbiEi family antitoxin domain-containing protein [Dermacoccus sp. GAS27A]|uniref:type IV toxin-antitoxin system AbiEi family antitoxin domain-containing protein n=1 Tax=Dermacoccus sp. GAS27A TaxID=3156270 RepID=UPI00383939B1